MKASSITMMGKTTGVDGAIDTSNLVIVADGDVTLESTVTADSLHVTATGDLELSHSITLRSPPGHTASALVAGGEVALGDNVVISGTSDSVLTVTGASVAFAPSSIIRGIDTRIVATEGGVRLGTIDGGALAVRAPGDIVLGRLFARGASLVSLDGNIDFGGPVQIGGPGVHAAALRTAAGLGADGSLYARAPGSITIEGPMAAAGGITLAAGSIVTTGEGYLSDNLNAGMPIVLRGDRIAISFRDPALGAQPLNLNVAGYTAPAARSARFFFDTARPIDFTTLKVLNVRVDAGGTVRYAPWSECSMLPVAAGSWLEVWGGPAGRCAQPPALDPVEARPIAPQPSSLSQR